MIRSSFNPEGLELGQGTTNMTALFGLSDFWHTMFEDPNVIDTLLEGEAQLSSDAYSQFIQKVCGLSLDDVQATVGYQTKLIYLTAADLVEGTTYALPETMLSMRYIANRPFAPTVTLEPESDFSISSDGLEITFAVDPFLQSFPKRKITSSTGTVEQIAIWVVDCHVDEGILYERFGKLIGIDKDTATDNYRNFLHGMFFLYTHGPNMEHMRRGLNLILGIPVLREEETVLDVRMYMETNNYMVITNKNHYVIPYGMEPLNAIYESMDNETSLPAYTPLATWLEISDYTVKDDWWVNLRIPAKLIPNIPTGHSRYASEGSFADEMMRKFLKYHSFLVKITVSNFQGMQFYKTIGDLVTEIKPAHTTPVYTWAVTVADETIDEMDESFKVRATFALDDNIVPCFDDFHRDMPEAVRLYRKKIIFNRGMIPSWVFDSSTSLETVTSGTEGVNGVIGRSLPFKAAEKLKDAWLNTLFNRGSETLKFTRDWMRFGTRNKDLGVSVSMNDIPEGSYSIPLYVITKSDAQDRLGTTLDASAKYTEIEYSSIWNTPVDGRNYMGKNINYFINFASMTEWISGDTVRIYPIDSVYFGVYRITTSPGSYIGVFPTENPEKISISIYSAPTRGLGRLGNFEYLDRVKGNWTRDGNTTITTSNSGEVSAYAFVDHSKLPIIEV